MKTDCTFSMFCDQFTGSQYDSNFSYNGKKALWDYLEQLSDEGVLGDSFDPLDIVALCCDFSEYESAEEYAKEFFEFEGMEFNEDGDEVDTPEEVEEKALKFLQKRTTVIEFDGGIIAQCF